MAGTFTQLHIQVVYAVKFRDAQIKSEWEEDLYKYTTGIIQNFEHKVLAINGTSDHVHILLGLRPKQSISELVQKIKANSSKWINEKGVLKHKFEWQDGYGAFSYTKSDVSKVATYIENQKQHHQKKTFREEYLNILQKLDIQFDEAHIFQDLI